MEESRRPASILTRLRHGQGPFWSALKSLAKAVLHVHLPASGAAKPLFRWLYALHVAAREGLGYVLRVLWFEPLFRSQCESVGERFYMEQLPHINGHGRIRLGDGVQLSGKSSIAFSNRLHARSELSIGDDTFIGHNCGFSVADSVRIGRHCLLASGVNVSDFDGHPLDAARRRKGEPTPAKQIRPVVIEDNVWIGARALVLKGVTIGARSIVAAQAVVVKDVPPDVIVAGNPARIVRSLACVDATREAFMASFDSDHAES